MDPLDELQVDPCYRYFRDLATPGHRRVLESRARLIGVTAMQRSGKTTLMRASAAAYFRGIHPWRKRLNPVQVLVVAPSMMQLATIYKKGFLNSSGLYVTPEQAQRWPDLREIVKLPLIPSDELLLKPSGKPDISWGVSKFGPVPSVIRHIDGSEMYFHISGDKHSWERIEGMDFHAIFRDEANGNENIGNTFITRLMEHWGKPENPDAGFYIWGASELQVVQERLDFLKKCEEGAKFHGYYTLETADNPKVTQQNREDAAGMMTEDEANKRIWGTSSAVSGALVYGKHFSRDRHVLKVRQEPSPEANLWACWDPGFAHEFGLGCAFIEPNKPNKIVMDRCYHAARKTLDYQVNCLLEWLDGRALEGVVYDSTGATKSDYSKGEKAFIQFQTALEKAGVKIHRGFQPGRNVYKDTVPLVWRYLDPDTGNSNADPLFVINPESKDSPGTEWLVNQFYSYRFKVGANPKLQAQSIHRVNDEGVDFVRYLISRQPRWVTRPPNHKRHQPLARTSIPFHRPTITDPLADDPSLPEEMRRHRAMLRESAALMRSRTNGGQRRLGSRYVGGL